MNKRFIIITLVCVAILSITIASQKDYTEIQNAISNYKPNQISGHYPIQQNKYDKLLEESPELLKEDAISLKDVSAMPYPERWQEDFWQSLRIGINKKNALTIPLQKIISDDLTSEERVAINRYKNHSITDYNIDYFAGIPASIAEKAPIIAAETIKALRVTIPLLTMIALLSWALNRFGRRDRVKS